MRKIKRYIFLLLVTILIVASACGCGKKNKVTIDKDTIYREEELKIAIPSDLSIDRSILCGDKLVFVAYSYDDFGQKAKWGSVNLDGSNLKTYDMETEEGEYKYIDRFLVTDSGNVILNVGSYKSYMEGDEYFSTYTNVVESYSTEGKLLGSIDITKQFGEEVWLQNIICFDDKIMLNLGDKICVCNDKLGVEKEVKSEGNEYYNSFIKLKDGSYAVSMWDENGQCLYKFDKNNIKAGDKIEIPFSFYSYNEIQSGVKAGYDILLRDNNKVCGYNIGDAEPKTLINFIDSDIYTSYFISFDAVGSNEFIGASMDYSSNTGELRTCRYTKVDPSEVTDKKVITLGCFYIYDELKRDIINFNKTNPDYRISIIDYESYITEDDWEAGTKKFNSDIVSGQGPDIIVSSGTASLSQYAGKGLFVDLNKFIDKDPDIDKDDLFPNVIEALSAKGKLFALAPSFYVQTVIAKKSLLNGMTGWTIQEMIDYEKTLSEDCELFEYATRASILSRILYASGDTFINEKEAKCNFNSDEFIALLEYIKTLPEEADYGYEDGIYAYAKPVSSVDDYYTKWRNNRVLLSEMTISNLRDFNYAQAGMFGEQVEFIGYPSADRNGSILYFNRVFLISSKSSNQDAAWEFVRRYFTKEAMSKVEYGFPISMSRYDEMAKEAMQRPYYIDENNEKVEYDEEYWMGGDSITLSPISQAETERIKEFLKTVTKISPSFDDIYTIIEEEAAYFFEGEKSASDVANIIQSRADIYIKEKQ